MPSDLTRALSLLGPLEGRIMRAVWSGRLGADFVVRRVQKVAPELAYTTLMTTLQRMAGKRLLIAEQQPGERAYRYRAAGTPTDYLAEVTRRRVRELIDQFGEGALAAFIAELDEVGPEHMDRLRRLAE